MRVRTVNAATQGHGLLKLIYSVVSDVTSGLIVIFLVLHFIFEFMSKKDQGHLTQNVRIAGRHFMLQTTVFLSWVALAALIFSRIVRGATFINQSFDISLFFVGRVDLSPRHIFYDRIFHNQ